MGGIGVRKFLPPRSHVMYKTHYLRSESEAVAVGYGHQPSEIKYFITLSIKILRCGVVAVVSSYGSVIYSSHQGGSSC
jgi:nitrate reductase NapE component